MPSKKNWANVVLVILIFSVLISGAAVSALTEDRISSTQEARMLLQFPVPSWDTLLDGSWFQTFETYCKDQFIERDRCMTSYYSFLDSLQVIERNGYVRGTDNHILNVRNSNITSAHLESAKQFGTSQVDAMLKLSAAASEYGGTVIYMNVPYKMEFFADMYPEYYENGKEITDRNRFSIIEKAKQAGITVVETYDLLRSHEDEYIFYTTDHHWTIRGAYYAYQELLHCINDLDPSRELVCPAWEEQNVSVRQERMVGSYLRVWGDAGTIWEDHMEYAAFSGMPEYIRYESGEPSDLPILDRQLNAYGAYMYGDHANTRIETGRATLPSILYVGLSYTNPLEYLSVYNFNTVESLDPRHFTGSICDHIRQAQPDYVVIVKDDIYEGNHEFSCTVE